MGRIYATPDQFTAWTGKADDDSPALARQLTRASEDIDDALRTAVYATDAAGMPIYPDVIEALANATCAQVEYQQETGDTGTGAQGRWDSVSLGPVSLSGRKDAPAGGPTGLDLAPRAERALRRAGLLPGVIC